MWFCAARVGGVGSWWESVHQQVCPGLCVCLTLSPVPISPVWPHLHSCLVSRSFTFPTPLTPIPLPLPLPPFLISHVPPQEEAGSLGSPQQPTPKNTVWFCLRGVSPALRDSLGWGWGAGSCLLGPDPYQAFPSPTSLSALGLRILAHCPYISLNWGLHRPPSSFPQINPPVFIFSPYPHCRPPHTPVL